MIASNDTKKRYPIGAVSEMTGVNSVTLRAWERRYGLIKPERTPKGHRLYSPEDINLIEAILEYLERGLSISKVADRIKRAETDQPPEQTSGDAWIKYRHRMIDAIGYFDEGVLNAIYNDVMSLYPVDVVTKRLIEPLLIDLGARWARNKDDSEQVPVAEEHFFSVFIRNKLGARFHHRNAQNQGPRLLAACLPGENHEFGLLLFTLAAHTRGYRLILLGGDMPLNELPVVIERAKADAVVLSGSDRLSCMKIYRELLHLVSMTSVPVFVGGALSKTCHAELEVAGVESIGKDLVEGLTRIKQKLLGQRTYITP
jgi:DNA-binding transcriptional MerR regulator